MTEQEQIEKIAKYVCNACEYGIYGACSKRQTDVKRCSLALKTAKHIYNAGYRKIPENAVVLTKEEYIDLSRNYVREQIEQARKETAKEILDKLNALMEQYHYKSTAWRNCANFIKETYGAEVEE